jgi:hypothetical protein
VMANDLGSDKETVDIYAKKKLSLERILPKSGSYVLLYFTNSQSQSNRHARREKIEYVLFMLI